MNCNDLLDRVYEYAGDEELPLLLRIHLGVHCFFCPQCAQELERFEVSRDLLRNDFFPPAPDFEDQVMAQINREADEMEEAGQDIAGVSFRNWVIAGLVMLVSLSTSFFGGDFVRVSRSLGSSFLLPVGLTIGVVLTGYGALFIGSHLKELSNRFGLH
jgi:anti-sigma factor RsiW